MKQVKGGCGELYSASGTRFIKVYFNMTRGVFHSYLVTFSLHGLQTRTLSWVSCTLHPGSYIMCAI